MPRPKQPVSFYLKKIINEEIFKFSINEILDGKEIDYKIINCRSVGDYPCQAYTFKTKSGNSYDVEFYRVPVNFDIDNVIDEKNMANFIEWFGTHKTTIGFTLSDRAKKYDNTAATMDDPYIKRTNYWEQYELLSYIIYLIEEFIKNNPEMKIYSFVKNTFNRNLSVYNKIYEKVFKNQFNRYEFEEEFLFLKQY